DIGDLFRAPEWFRGRLISLSWGEPEVIDCLKVGAIALILGVPLRLWRWWRGVLPRVSVAILLPTLVSFVFVFLTAPMPRYQGATIWILAAQLVLLGVGESVLRGRWLPRTALVGLIAAATGLPFARGAPLWSAANSFELVGRTSVEEVRLASGLVVTVPKGTPTCWDASLPCTPEPHPGLRLRRDGDLASGFTIDLALGDTQSGAR
ncbi:MAG TPA: hypothetical protein VMT89_12000, partial [Candidatus Acidoferrales bacterium]|nr:hypothetical protein [Candidatus Acidoferrales bacterium]